MFTTIAIIEQEPLWRLQARQLIREGLPPNEAFAEIAASCTWIYVNQAWRSEAFALEKSTDGRWVFLDLDGDAYEVRWEEETDQITIVFPNCEHSPHERWDRPRPNCGH